MLYQIDDVSIMAPEVISALLDWIASSDSQGVLIGGLAFSHYGKPRYTQDVDILYLSEKDIPTEVMGFKRIRGHAFEDRKRGIEIEVLSPTFLNLSFTLVQQVFATAIVSDGMRIASPSAIIALKLGRLSPQDHGLRKSSRSIVTGLHLPEVSHHCLMTAKDGIVNKMVGVRGFEPPRVTAFETAGYTNFPLNYTPINKVVGATGLEPAKLSDLNR